MLFVFSGCISDNIWKLLNKTGNDLPSVFLSVRSKTTCTNTRYYIIDSVPCKRVPRTMHSVSGTYISCTRYCLSWIWYIVSRIFDLDLLSRIWNDNYGNLHKFIARLWASFGPCFIFYFSDFELRISELGGVSHSQSCRSTAVSYLVYWMYLAPIPSFFFHLRARKWRTPFNSGRLDSKSEKYSTSPKLSKYSSIFNKTAAFGGL